MAAGLAAVFVIAPGAAAGDNLAVTVSSARATRIGGRLAARPIPSGFAGVSMDYCAIAQYTGDRPNSVLDNLVGELAPEGPLIRVGGDGPDATCQGVKPRPIGAAPRAVSALARATHGKLILGIDLEAHNLVRARREVRALLRGIDPRKPYGDIDAIEIGNEPDLLRRYGPSATAQQVPPYFARYLSDFGTWARMIRTITRERSFGIAGPALGRLGLPWFSGVNIGNLLRFARSPARPTLITVHSYPILSQLPCPGSACPSIVSLLSESDSRGLVAPLVPLVGRARGLVPIRDDELNSVTGGGVSGVSDAFASALWALDTLFELAHAGVAGANFHTFTDSAYALYTHPAPGKWLVRPEYYGLLMFSRAAPAGSVLLRTAPNLAATGAANVKVWATRGRDGQSRVLVINKDPLAHTIVLDGGGLPVKTGATITRLQASPDPNSPTCPLELDSTDLCATGGVTLGGQTFGPEEQPTQDQMRAETTEPPVSTGGKPIGTEAGGGGDRTSTGLLGQPARDTCTQLVLCTPDAPAGTIVVPMPAGTAALITGRTPGNAGDSGGTRNRESRRDHTRSATDSARSQ